jgi:23S rRNA (cytidine1920-2'-O)/16S rRNA (cytidine1409-2'-O)-methyltransferase
MTGTRLDVEVVNRRLLPSRSGARRAIREGRVAVDGLTIVKPAYRVAAGADIAIHDDAQIWVSRAGVKLAHALDRFPVDVADRSAVDVGASTGGFTDVLLDRGATRVVAVDVGRDQLHQSLRGHPRVESRERLNIRDADPVELGAPFGVVVADLSFISLRVVAGALATLGDSSSDWIVLVKPQFEVGRENVGRTGVVADPGLRGGAIVDVARGFAEQGLVPVGCVASPIEGGSGNREALLWLRWSGTAMDEADLYKVLHDD